MRLWQTLREQLPYDGALSLLDSLPLYVCRFARAKRCRHFHAEAAYGHDELPTDLLWLPLAPAGLLAQARGWALGDRN